MVCTIVYDLERGLSPSKDKPIGALLIMSLKGKGPRLNDAMSILYG